MADRSGSGGDSLGTGVIYDTPDLLWGKSWQGGSVSIHHNDAAANNLGLPDDDFSLFGFSYKKGPGRGAGSAPGSQSSYENEAYGFSGGGSSSGGGRGSTTSYPGSSFPQKNTSKMRQTI